jgi:hypothetical protein
MKISIYQLVKACCVALLALAILLFVTSCSSVRKTAHTAIVNHDSTGTTKVDSSAISHEKTITVVNHDSAGTRVTEIEFPWPIKEYPVIHMDNDSVRKAWMDTSKGNNYGGYIYDTTYHHGFYMVDLTISKDGSIHTNARPTRIRITETAINKGKDSTAKEVDNSSHKTAATNTTVSDHRKTVDTDKKKTGSTFFGTLLLFGGAAFGIYMLFLAWKKRKTGSIFSTKSTNMKSLLLFVMCSVFLTSCGHYPDGTSVWAVQMWIAPLLTAIGAALSGWAAYRSWRSGTTVYQDWKYHDEKGRIPLYKIGFFWYSVVLTVATIAIIISVNWEK